MKKSNEQERAIIEGRIDKNIPGVFYRFGRLIAAIVRAKAVHARTPWIEDNKIYTRLVGKPQSWAGACSLEAYRTKVDKMGWNLWPQIMIEEVSRDISGSIPSEFLPPYLGIIRRGYEDQMAGFKALAEDRKSKPITKETKKCPRKPKKQSTSKPLQRSRNNRKGS